MRTAEEVLIFAKIRSISVVVSFLSSSPQSLAILAKVLPSISAFPAVNFLNYASKLDCIKGEDFVEVFDYFFAFYSHQKLLLLRFFFSLIHWTNFNQHSSHNRKIDVDYTNNEECN